MGLFKPAWMTDTKDFAKAKKIAQSICDAETDERKLVEIAKKAPKDVIRQAAIEKISDLSILADLAQNDTRTDTRLTAINMLGHRLRSAAEGQVAIWNQDIQPLLVEIVNTDSDIKIRIAAVSVLTDSTALEYIAKNNGDYKIRSIAFKKMLGVEPTASFQSASNFVPIIKNISDRAILEDIARNSEKKHEKRESEIRLFILSGGAKKHEGNHIWMSLDCCLKKCSICDALEYDHRYKGFNFSDNGFVKTAEFRCEKCGHSAKSHEGFTEEQDYDTREYGLIER